MKEIFKTLCFACLLSCLAGKVQVSAQTGNLRQFSSRNGLSNSAILSLCQDSQGQLWIGTCDGLNIFDGSTIRLYSPDRPGQFLSGNLINQMLEAEPGVLWIQTNYGLDRLDTRQGSILTFPEFQDKTLLARSPDNQVFVLKDDGRLYAYLESGQRFEQMEMEPVQFASAEALSIDRHQVLRIFTSDGDTRSYRLTSHSRTLPTLSPADPFEYADRLQRAFTDGTSIWFTDRSGTLYEYDTDNRKAYHVADLGPELLRRGSLSSVIRQGDDYYIGFKNGGMLRLCYQYDRKEKYRSLPMDIGSGIFCLLKDRFQDIVWAGTDGQGLYMHYNDAFSVRHTLLDTPDWQVSHPVRALYCDSARTLWIGTKGSGILCVDHYDPYSDSPAPSRRLTTANTPALTDNSVYCFAPGRPDLLWIGTEEGINYYSYARRRMERLAAADESGKPVRYVHAIVQPNDTTLWVATVGEGIVCINLRPSPYGRPAVRSVERTLLNHGRMASNYFFTILQEGDSVLWFGNRGLGVYRLEVPKLILTPYLFDRPGSNQTANDVFAVHKNSQGYWLGTGAGLLHASPDLSRPDTLAIVLRNTVHGILEDDLSNLWVSTNLGLTRLDRKNHVQQRYNADNGLEVTEFSDGAFWKDPRNGILFFGGTNGFVTIRPEAKAASGYLPPIRLKSLSVSGRECRMDSLLHVGHDRMSLQLAHDRNFFRLDFMAIDYINGNNLTYAYRLDEAGGPWIDLDGNWVSLSNLSPGRYTLRIKYRNNSTGQEVFAPPILVRVTPPWYASLPARVLYLLLFLLACACGMYAAARRYRRRQRQLIEQMDRQKRDEIYESKLRFFTNITHEFCTPLTLICGPCEKILASAEADGAIHHYATLIRRNADRLNSLIQELIEFRRLETGHRVRTVRSLPLSDKLREIAGAFAELAGNRGMDYRLHIQPDVTWNTDEACFSTIATNLLSNAFKYAPDGGEISVTLTTGADCATLRVTNSGKGIARENLSKIFDRYTVLDSMETNGKNARNGLGLAICQSMANLLEGDIAVESTPGRQTTFTVRLPQLELTPANTMQPVAIPRTPLAVPPASESPAPPEQAPGTFDKNRQTLLVIDDDPSMLWFLSDMFKEQYNVLSFDNAPDALASLERRLPDLIVSDVMMPGTDGLSFARKVKQNKLWSHIPLILLSALQQEDDQVKGLESGADAYVTKPFSVKYLERLAARLLQRGTDLKEYYGSILSSFSVEDGTPVHKEDREFLNRMFAVIERHIARPDLSIDLLSGEMGLSTRQFYRKLKPLTSQSPADIIKECRLKKAEHLLLHEGLTVDEVMEQSGFANRSTFYKLFTQRFGMPPRQYREQRKEEVRSGYRNERPSDAPLSPSPSVSA